MLVGRGGKRGKTSGRGGKGQTARAGNKTRPELRDFIKRVPKLRGRGVNQNKSFAKKLKIINLVDIDTLYTAGDIVNPASLIERTIISTIAGKIPQVKILATGEITKKLIVEGCLISKEAEAKILKAGGEVRK